MLSPALLSRTVVLLHNLRLFSDLPEDALLSLAENCTLSHFEPEETIFYQGDRTDRVWIVRQGQVKIVHHDEDGREVILELIPPGEVFGGGTIFLPKQPATARAMIPVEVISFSTDVYEEFLIKFPRLMLRLIRMLGQRLYGMKETNILTGERVERRLAHILLKLMGRCGTRQENGILITIPLSRQDLADMCGTTLETTIRTMSKLNKQKVAKTLRGGYVLILNEEELRRMAKS
ncbi:MAG: helix-turn-helix domain-containing protein [Anaerolineales bacterium]